MPQVAHAHKVLWTEEEYLSFEDESPTKHEFLDGRVYAMAGAPERHNVICAHAIIALGNLLRGGSCRIFTSDQRIHVVGKRFYTYPDGGIVCGKSEYHPKGGNNMVLMNPSLLFEVLSPSTEEYDRGEKLFLYRQIESLKDVLLIDPETRTVEHYRRVARGWKSVTRKRGALEVLGGAIDHRFAFEVKDLFEETAE